jgi:hypothetical protein
VVLLNDTGLFDILFDDAHVMDFMGALEYEPGAYRLLYRSLCCFTGLFVLRLWVLLSARASSAAVSSNCPAL